MATNKYTISKTAMIPIMMFSIIELAGSVSILEFLAKAHVQSTHQEEQHCDSDINEIHHKPERTRSFMVQSSSSAPQSGNQNEADSR